MESTETNLVVVSKTKKFIKDLAGMNTSANFFPEVTKFVEKACDEAIENAGKAHRKTVMGRDFVGFDEQATQENEEEVLVVASKVKKYIKDKSGMNTSSQVMPALTKRVQELCRQASDSAKGQGRKTVMDRDVSQLIQ